MSAIRNEVLEYIDNIPDVKLEALKPLLSVLVNDAVVIETDLSYEEKEIIARGRKEYESGSFIPLNDIF